MNAPRFIRGTKSRFFLYVGALSLVGLIIYVYRGTRLQLDDVRQGIDKCKQQQESLSAQLQVIFEYKLRLEKSLQQEKNEHRQTKDELHSKAQEEKASKDKELLEAMNKYSSLQQQHKILKSQHTDLDDECNKVRIQQLQSVEDKSKLESQVHAIHLELEQIQAAREKELESLKSNYMQLEVELDKISKLYKDCSSKTQQSSNKILYLQKQNNQLERELAHTKDQYKSCQIDNYGKTRPQAEVAKSSLENPKPLGPASVAKSPTEASKLKTSTSNAQAGQHLKPDSGNFLPPPDIKQDSVDKANSKSTTPQINPEALISEERSLSNNGNNVVPMPPPENEAARKESMWNNAMHQDAQVHAGMFDRPAGVVPAPHGYDRSHNQNIREQNNEIVGNDIGNANFHNNNWQWNYRKPDHPQLARNYQVQQDPRLHYENHRNAMHHVANGHNDIHQLQNNHEPVHYGAENHIEVADNPLKQHDNLLRFQYLNNRNAGNLVNDLQHRDRLLAEPQRNPPVRGEAKEIPRNAAAYPYNGDYERDGQKNDLQLEEAEEEGDDDVDQIDYANEGAKQNNNAKQPERHEKRDGVMGYPK